MLTQENFNRIARAMPLLQQAESQLLREFMQMTSFARIPAGRDVFVDGDDVDAIALLIKGEVRVYKIGETGREITLYRFGQGESCILTANAILSQQSFPAIATVEKDAEAVMVPAAALRDWVKRYDLWRGFVFDLFSQRLSSLMEIVEEVAFRRLDGRVAGFLLESSRRVNPIQTTHQEIAFELGSSREVISRLLGELSSQGVILLGRGKIEVLDFSALEKLAVM
jgi:CRP/FNR family transcriptional regulator